MDCESNTSSWDLEFLSDAHVVLFFPRVVDCNSQFAVDLFPEWVQHRRSQAPALFVIRTKEERSQATALFVIRTKEGPVLLTHLLLGWLNG